MERKESREGRESMRDELEELEEQALNIHKLFVKEEEEEREFSMFFLLRKNSLLCILNWNNISNFSNHPSFCRKEKKESFSLSLPEFFVILQTPG